MVCVQYLLGCAVRNGKLELCCKLYFCHFSVLAFGRVKL